jgi:hypothetical protein
VSQHEGAADTDPSDRLKLREQTGALECSCDKDAAIGRVTARSMNAVYSERKEVISRVLLFELEMQTAENQI